MTPWRPTGCWASPTTCATTAPARRCWWTWVSARCGSSPTIPRRSWAFPATASKSWSACPSRLRPARKTRPICAPRRKRWRICSTASAATRARRTRFFRGALRAHRPLRRDGRAADSGGLENHLGFTPHGGSNPSPSATILFDEVLFDG